MKHLLLPFLCMLPIFVLAQENKIEKEDRIKKEEMPENVSQFLRKNLPEDIKKVRYYYETDGQKKSYEAKFKYDRYNFSVEFNKEGNLEDIEVTAKKNELIQSVYHNIEAYLDQNYARYRIEKIQAQYLSKDGDARNAFNRSLHFRKFQPDNYELIVATKENGKLEKFEMLFNEMGIFLEQRKIIRNSYDYLLF